MASAANPARYIDGGHPRVGGRNGARRGSMADRTVLWGMRQRRGGGDYMTALPMEDPQSPSARTARTHRPRWCPRVMVYSHLTMACFVTFMAMALGGLYMYVTYELPGDHRYMPAVEAALASPKPGGYHDGTKVFIAAMFSNNMDILPRWIKEFSKVIHYLGRDNVFISIVESNSRDGTPEILDDWKNTLDRMGIPHLIPSADMPGNVRIDFLSAVRNLALAPLVERGGYDVVLFSNDILIEAESVVELLKTKDGEWDMVCGLDLGRWGMYDAWVLRDRLGRLVSSLWPYFLEVAGREAVMADEPAPVFACWNGIVAFRADPVLPISLRTPGRLSTSPLSRPLPSTHPAYPQPLSLTPAQTPPLAFRSSAQKECFSSESFNLPFDMQRIYLNPRVINSYEWKHYIWFKYITRHWVVMWWMKNVEAGDGMQSCEDNYWGCEARLEVGRRGMSSVVILFQGGISASSSSGGRIATRHHMNQQLFIISEETGQGAEDSWANILELCVAVVHREPRRSAGDS
ncbi:cryptococcal mannosyltransferase 1-domain-containing protein [Mycena vulgaris]|nr:cryptococcal mannosyltransferase 1-domain-containing protein [Mycena vulgaris]